MRARIMSAMALAIAASGADLIPVGWLTRSALLLDIGLYSPKRVRSQRDRMDRGLG